MKIHILVEGPSERTLLESWAPRFLRDCSVKIHPHQGKGTLPQDLDAVPEQRRRGLLDQLPAKLRGFASGSGEEGIVVLVDADNDNCVTLAKAIAQAAKHCAPKLHVIVRVAVEETEAFYLSDLGALKRAFPTADLGLAHGYAPDSICGTWELFGKVVDDGGGNKVAWAEAMGPKLTTDPSKSRSPSFRALCRALTRLATPPPASKRPRKKRRRRTPTRKRAGN